MKLTLGERFAALRILPSETNFTTLKILRDLQENLAVTEEETKKWDVRTVAHENNTVTTQWSKEGGEAEVEIKMGEMATAQIATALEKLDKENKLTNDLFTLYEKFIVNESDKK